MVSSVYRYVINIGQIEPAGLVKTMFAEHLLQLVALEGLEVLRQITNNSWVFVYRPGPWCLLWNSYTYKPILMTLQCNRTIWAPKKLFFVGRMVSYSVNQKDFIFTTTTITSFLQTFLNFSHYFLVQYITSHNPYSVSKWDCWENFP